MPGQPGQPGEKSEEGERAPEADPGVPPELAKLGISASDWEKIQATLKSDVGGGANGVPEEIPRAGEGVLRNDERRMRFLAFRFLILATGAAFSAETADPVFAEWRDRVDPAVERGLEVSRRVQRGRRLLSRGLRRLHRHPGAGRHGDPFEGPSPTEGPYVVTLNKCIDFVLANQLESGLFEKGNAGSGPMYAHNISTLFLSEVSGMVDPARQEKIAKALPPALKLILKAQAVKKDALHQGGWRYHPGSTDSDTSCSGWALMALRSAKLNGAAVPDEAIARGGRLSRPASGQEGGHFGYMDRTDHARSLTGMGLLCLELAASTGPRRPKLQRTM